MKRLLRFSLALAILAGSLEATLAADGWIVDFKEAQKRAAAEGKDILMEFTGSDWCPPCIQLKKNVLDSEVFQTKAPEQFILLKLDSPKDKSHQTPEEIEQYQKLSAQFKITGVPTIVLADPQGRPFAKMVGYGGEPAADYVKRLGDQVQIREERDAAFAEAKSASGIEKAKLLDQAIGVVDAEMAVAQYQEVVEEIIELDPENAAGLKAKYDGILRQSEVREAMQEIRRSAAADGPEAVLKKLDELITKLNPTGEGLQEVLLQKGAIQYGQDKNASKATLEAALKVAPESSRARQIQQILATQFSDVE